MDPRTPTTSLPLHHEVQHTHNCIQYYYSVSVPDLPCSALVSVSVLEPNQTHTHISPCSMHNYIDGWSSSLFPVLCFLRGPVRFSYTHAIPTVGEQSRFRGEVVVRDRRVSVISRTHPSENTPSV